MVPLEVGNPSSSIFPPSPLEVKRHCFKNTISNFTKNIDCKVNVEGLNKKPIESIDNQSNKSYKDIINFHLEHRTTPYKPSFNQKKHSNPGVGSYTPQYDAILPSSIKISLKEKKGDDNNIEYKKSNIKKKKVRIKKDQNQNIYSKNKSNQGKNNSSADYESENSYYYDIEYEYEYDLDNDKKRISRKEKQFDAYSTADVISLYQANMRDYDTDSINYPKFENNADEIETIKYNAYKESLKGESLCFRHDGHRNIFDDNSITKNIAPADPIPLPPPPVPNMSQQKNRELSLLDRLKFFNENAEKDDIAGKRADDGTYKHFNMHNSQVADLALSLSRNYPDAATQLDKLKPRTPSAISLKYQASRFGSPQKNKRVEFLDKITREQVNTIKKISKSQNNENEPTKNVSVLSQAKSKKSVKMPLKSRPKSAFDLQSSRPKSLFPGLPETSPGSKYPSDPIESYKKTIIQAKPIKISDNGNRDLAWTTI